MNLDIVSAKRIQPQLGDTLGDCDGRNIGIGCDTEGVVSDGGDAVLNHDFLNVGKIAVPWGVRLAVIAYHLSGAGDGQNTVISELPGQIIAAGAAGENVGSGGGEGIKVLKQGGEDFLRFGKLGLLVTGQGIIGIIGFLYLGINLCLLLSGHGLDFLQGGEGFDQGADGLHGFVRFGLGGIFARFGALRAGIGAGLLRTGFHIAAAFVVGMVAVRHQPEAAVLLRADVGAGGVTRFLVIPAGIVMDVDALGHGLIAILGMFMGAGTARDRRGVAALACMEGMVLAKAVRFLRERENREVSENQDHRKQTAQRPFPKQRLHIASSCMPKAILMYNIAHFSGLSIDIQHYSMCIPAKLSSGTNWCLNGFAELTIDN